MSLRPPFIALLLILLVGCQGNPSPTAPADDGGEVGDFTSNELPEDAVDEGLRELTGLMYGDLKLRGSVTAPAGYVDSPATVTQPATIGQIALVRLHATASDGNLTRPIYSDLRGPGGAYSSMSFTTNNASQYKALYILRNEDLSMRVHNRPSYSGTLNATAADVNYTFETKPIEDSSEPNDDENTTTITDRTQARNLNVGTLATRSFFFYNSFTRDREDWFSTTLTAGMTYRYKMTSYNPRYGTWSYTLKLFNAAGTQVGSTTTMPVGNIGGNLTTPVIPATGTYYLQIVGIPYTRTFGSNVDYSLYTITPCQVPVVNATTGINFTPQRQWNWCPGTPGTWAATSPAPIASHSWNFGGGATPNTSTLANPQTTLGAPGTYNLTLTVTAPCGASYTVTKPYMVECSWGQTFGRTESTPTSTISPSDLAVTADGHVWVTGYFNSQLVAFPVVPSGGPQTFINAASGGETTGFIARLAPNGDVLWASPIATGNHPSLAHAIALDDAGNPWVTGSFSGTLDFDVTSGVRSLGAVGTAAFLAQYGTDNTPGRPAFKWGGGGLCTGLDLIKDGPTSFFVGGNFSSSVDFDPGTGVLNRTAGGVLDPYVLNVSTSSDLIDFTTWGAADDDYFQAMAASATQLYVVGGFSTTVDFDPGPGTANRTSPFDDDGYALALNRTTLDYNWVSTLEGGSANVNGVFKDVTVNAQGAPRFLASLLGQIIMVPGTGSSIVFGTNPINSAHVFALTTGGAYEWYGYGDGSSYGTAIGYVPASDSLLISGGFTGSGPTAFRIAGGSSTSVTSLDGGDAFLWRVGASTPKHYTVKSLANSMNTRESITCIGAQSSGNGNVYIGGTFQNFAIGLDGLALADGFDDRTGFVARLNKNGLYIVP